jgi:protein-disulfide isomerase
MSKWALRAAIAALSWVWIACGAASEPGVPVVEAPRVAPDAPSRNAADAAAASRDQDAGPVPVSAADPSRGSAQALVTIVQFSEFQCPFCKRVSGTLAELLSRYGHDDLRVVWKHNPLEFHKLARPAAEASVEIHARGGDRAFWAFHDAAFSAKGNSFDEAALDDALRAAGSSQKALEKWMGDGRAARKVDDDVELAKRTGVRGVPAFFINGVFLSGAQPIERFASVIDEELAKAKALIAAGTPRSRVYQVITAKNFAAPKTDAPPPDAAKPPPDTKTVWRVPIAGSPVRGKPTALVTIVEFSDYQCPFCRRAEGTVRQVLAHYGDKVRIVLKHNPLPFHPRAEPAAELALEVRARKGDAAFWKAHEALLAGPHGLEDADLEAVARSAGLDPAAAMRAVAARKHEAIIENDKTAAEDIDALGTPAFFVNGRRLTGAQPFEKFRELIDEEIANAEAQLKRGVPAARLYETLQKSAQAKPPPEKIQVLPPTKDNPGRGPLNAKVVIQQFSDFQCPFCQRVQPTLRELEKAFPGQIRIVWRNMPLAFHADAALAAEAAIEAYRQKGDKGFWSIHDALFADQSKLERADLDQIAAQLGLDMSRFAQALDNRVHRPLVEADSKAARDAKISGTPAFVINGYFLSGAQPLGKFKKVVRLALAGR